MYRFSFLVLAGVVSVGAQPDTGLPFPTVPPGWSVTKTTPVFTREFAGVSARITNTHLVVDGQKLQVNVLTCPTEADAAKVRAALLRGKASGSEARFPQMGTRVLELIGELRTIERGYRELGFKQRVVYDVAFQATPLVQCEAMAWNRLFNAFLPAEPNEARVRELNKSFTYGDTIRLRTHGLGGAASTFTFGAKATTSKTEAEGEVLVETFANLPKKYDVPQIGVTGVVTCEAFALTPSKRKAGKELIGPTEFWPSADAAVVTLARKITGGAADPNAKVAALLAWFAKPENFRYDKTTVGSRHGALKALQQRFGQCWDFSDAFITLARAAGVPCRQVLGWVHGLSGHVWVEVLIEGEGWRPVDPQAGAGCDARYVPFQVSESGAVPLVYTSAVKVVPR